MNNTHTTTTTMDFDTINEALEAVREDYVASYVAHIKQEMVALRAIMDNFEHGTAGRKEIYEFNRAVVKYYGLKGRNYAAMAMTAWVKRIVTLHKGITKKGLNLNAVASITAVPSAGDFRMTITDAAGISCHARAVLVLPCDKRPHMRFICT